eukprot:TRINITY_DN69704_c0_g1_i2.p1 TRINITY_DN69704_c0_g1~~TRINITY_DN69704_c0_g1_i2.p1  ORF type:complete len:162 (+),score=47.68 TRINITY_DN69704_c0_g1_i2:112-597(+)
MSVLSSSSGLAVQLLGEESAGYNLKTAGHAKDGHAEDMIANQVLVQVAGADSDIHEDIVQEALSFVDTRLQAVAKTLQVSLQSSGEHPIDESIDAIMRFQQSIAGLKKLLAVQLKPGSKTRRKATKKIVQAEAVLRAIFTSLVLRACWKREDSGLPALVAP